MHPIRLALRALGATAIVALVASLVPGVAPAGAAAGSQSLNLANLDPTCKACDDFYRYATGGWRKSHTIPAGYPEYDSFTEVYDRNQGVLHGILEDAAKDTAAAPTTDEGRIGTFYAACMDEAGIEKAGLTPLQPELDRIAAVTTTGALVDEIVRLEKIGVDVGLGINSQPDTRNSDETIAQVNYGGLGMPDRDYYITAQNAAIRTKYHAFLIAQFTNLGESAADAATDADAVAALETTLAQNTPPDADLRDPLATYHVTPVAQLATIAPHVPWAAFLTGFNEPNLATVNLALPQYAKAYDGELTTVPLERWKSYLRIHLVDSFAQALPKRFRDTSFDFYSRTLSGVKTEKARWKRCVDYTDGGLGDPLGKVYVAKAFPPAAKTRSLALVNNLQATLHDDISTLAWMSPATRRAAEVKLAAYTKKIAYPNTWVDFSSVVLNRDDPYADDLIATRTFATNRDLSFIGKPTDRTLWGMTPPTVNAYYNPSNNEIVFPAGILQPPFFEAAADDALIYGAIGAVIGHEMTHGFDDQGRQYDAKGNLKNWWTASDAANFKQRAQCVVDQFNGYQVAPGVHENGRNVQGEAIADLGGLTIAYRAFEKTPQFKAGKSIQGLTPPQRFFIAYAQVWRELITPQYAKELAIVDVHPEDRFRVIGTLSNMPAFRAAFHCAGNAPMVRKNRCEIW